MKNARLIVPIALVCAWIFGCQQIEGECWPVSEDGQGEGAGGGPLVPGAGGFGEAPSEPQDVKPQGVDDVHPGCVAIGSFSASLFKFMVVVQDDGEDEGGGWQKATASAVKFADGRQHPPAAWTCSVWVAMPMRTAKHGKISASEAAEIAADVLTEAATPTMHSRSSWQPTAFCLALGDRMQSIFKSNPYKGLGATTGAKR